MKQLSDDEGYAAMYAFLEHRYNLTQSDDLGALLSQMSLLPDGGTADPALWHDWQRAIKVARDGGVKLKMELR